MRQIYYKSNQSYSIKVKNLLTDHDQGAVGFLTVLSSYHFMKMVLTEFIYHSNQNNSNGICELNLITIFNTKKESFKGLLNNNIETFEFKYNFDRNEFQIKKRRPVVQICMPRQHTVSP